MQEGRGNSIHYKRESLFRYGLGMERRRSRGYHKHDGEGKWQGEMDSNAAQLGPEVANQRQVSRRVVDISSQSKWWKNLNFLACRPKELAIQPDIRRQELQVEDIDAA